MPICSMFRADSPETDFTLMVFPILSRLSLTTLFWVLSVIIRSTDRLTIAEMLGAGMRRVHSGGVSGIGSFAK